MKKINTPITFKEFEKRVASDLKSLISQKIYKYIKTVPRKSRFFTSSKFEGTFIIFYLVGTILFISGIIMVAVHNGWILAYIFIGVGITATIVGALMGRIAHNFSAEIRKALTLEFKELNLFELYKELFNKFDGINCQGYEKILMPSLINNMGKWPLSKWSKNTKIIKNIPKFSLECFQTPVIFQLQNWYDKDVRGINSINVGLIEIDLQNPKTLAGLEFNFGTYFWDGLYSENLKEVVTENAQFNSKFTLYSNDQVKARVLFTPYCLEIMLNFEKQYNKDCDNSHHKWIVRKLGNKILIYFMPQQSFLLEGGFDVSKTNLKHLTTEIANNIIKDCYQVYAALSMAFITSLI